MPQWWSTCLAYLILGSVSHIIHWMFKSSEWKWQYYLGYVKDLSFKTRRSYWRHILAEVLGSLRTSDFGVCCVTAAAAMKPSVCGVERLCLEVDFPIAAWKKGALVGFPLFSTLFSAIISLIIAEISKWILANTDQLWSLPVICTPSWFLELLRWIHYVNESWEWPWHHPFFTSQVLGWQVE